MNRLFLLISSLLVLSLILAILVISQQYNVGLSASVPQIITIPRWSCDVTCNCYTRPAWASALFNEQIGTVPGEITICSTTNPGTNPSANPFGTNPFDVYGYESRTDCLNLCKAAYPNRNVVSGAPAQGSNHNCQQSGSCYVRTPTYTTTPLVSPWDFNPFTSTPANTPTPLVTR